jgi:hypothetical protein
MIKAVRANMRWRVSKETGTRFYPRPCLVELVDQSEHRLLPYGPTTA